MTAGRLVKVESWPDRPDHDEINAALTDAADAFNATYYESPFTADLRANAERTLAALRRVLDLIAPGAAGP